MPSHPAIVVCPVAEVAARIQASRYAIVSASPTRPSVFDLADFQAEAVQKAGRTLDRWGGVLIADSVGLGKTYVGLALVEQTVRSGAAAAVVVPAALRRTWRPGLERLRRDTGRRIALVSHAQMALGMASDGVFRSGSGKALIVVDEAHAFRNRHTKRYRTLARLCQDARVVLLTATPVNNSVMDLYALIRLFARDDAFRDLGVPALRTAFRAAAHGEAGKARARGRTPSSARPGGPVSVDPILPVVQAVVIRRTRRFIRDRYGAVRLPGHAGNAAVLTFPQRVPPHPVPYSLFGRPGAFEAVADNLLAMRFSALGVAAGGTSVPAGVAELVRLGLLKRLESGLHAFRLSVERQLRFHEAFLDALSRGFLLPTRLHRALTADDDAVQLLLQPLALEPAPPRLDRDRLARAVADDIARLQRLRSDTRASRGDPKLDALLALIATLAGQKVVVFSEFRDTAAYLWRRMLAAGLRTGRVDGAGAFLGGERAGRRVVIDRFAPRANAAPEPPPRERVDVLVATDVLAEGLNLQDAAHIVSYDLPWNPVRLIQRVGRIDRLGSLHDVVHPHFLLPGPQLDRLLGLHARIRAKLDAIGATVGLDAVVLDDDGARESVVQRLARGDPDVLDDLERADAGPVPGLIRRRGAGSAGPDTASDGGEAGDGDRVEPEDGCHGEHEDKRRGDAGDEPHRDAGDGGRRRSEAEQVPCAGVPSREPPRMSLVALEVDGTVRWFVVADGRARVDDAAAAAVLQAALDRRGPVAGPGRGSETGVPEHAGHVLEAALAAALRTRSLARFPPYQDRHSPAARAARQLQKALAYADGRLLEPSLVNRVDGLLRRLARPPDAGVESRIEEALRDMSERGRRPPPGRTPADDLRKTVASLEDATRGCVEDQAVESSGRPATARIRWIGALIAGPSSTAVRSPTAGKGDARITVCCPRS